MKKLIAVLILLMAFAGTVMAQMDLSKRGSGRAGDEYENGFCFGFGGDIGVRYFFSPAIGVFLEGDFDVFIPTKDYGGATVSFFAPAIVAGFTWKF